MNKRPDSANETYINRFGEIREDSQQISEFFHDISCKIILVYKGRFVCESSQLKLFQSSEIQESSYLQEFRPSFTQAEKEKQLPTNSIYLGNIKLEQIEPEDSKPENPDSNHLFVVSLDHSITINEKVELIDSRTLAFSSPPFVLETIFYAQGLISWHFSHQFCAKCGSQTQMSHSGHSRQCLSKKCEKQHFPRIEPAVIFSICRKANDEQSEDKILLARQSSWPEKRYSVIAGFAEHGESLEQSVAREAYEEVGLRVTNVQYYGSQPWPFPASLMIGFSCETTDEEIRLIDNELESAKWFSASEIKHQIESGELLAPFSISISWKILEHWYQQQTGQSIKSIKKLDE
ncbi:MAG: NAD(+) diphosphatase [Kangiella sp.]|nr:MAG: NAD(+) diphosphatase [Kangiella sp.]